MTERRGRTEGSAGECATWYTAHGTAMKHRFSDSQRYALWRAYDGRCFYCRELLEFQETTIDHVVPEWLLSRPDKLAELRAEYELDQNVPGFRINDFTNWVPAHFRSCNSRKGGAVLPKHRTLSLLDEVQRHLPHVRRELEKLTQQRSRSHALGSLGAALEGKHVTIEEVRRLLQDVERSQHAEEPLVLTFGLAIKDVEEELPEAAPRDYPLLCDWLEADLVEHLGAIIDAPFHYTEPSERSGEGLSVRIVFPGVDPHAFDRFDRPWWEILEPGTFRDIFGISYADAYPEPPSQERLDEPTSDG